MQSENDSTPKSQINSHDIIVAKLLNSYKSVLHYMHYLFVNLSRMPRK